MHINNASNMFFRKNRSLHPSNAGLRWIFLFSILFLSSGCLRSLHPWYTANDLSENPALIGTWENESKSEEWTFTKSQDGYRLSLVMNGESANFDLHHFSIGKNRFLDITASSPETKNDFYKFHLFPVHTIAKLALDRDEMQISLLDMHWFDEMLKRKKLSVKYERIEKQVILTAPTAELQKLVRRFANDSDAFPQSQSVLTRKK